jgi:hypothetical protein
MHERDRSRDSASTISENRQVRSFPGRLKSLTRFPSLRAMTRKPSCLISCSHTAPDGGLGAFVGKHGGMNPDGKVRGRDNISESYIAERRRQRKAPGRFGGDTGA